MNVVKFEYFHEIFFFQNKIANLRTPTDTSSNINNY